MTLEMKWDTAKNILCVRLDNMGDVLMTTPAIRALKVSRPGRRVTLLTSSPGANAAALVPEIDRVIVYDAPWVKNSKSAADGTAEYLMAQRLKEGAYDGSVIFTVYSQNPLPSALLCYLAGIPLRLAYCHENPYRLLTNWVPDPEPQSTIRHEVKRQLDLVATIGGRTSNKRMSLSVPPEARGRVRVLLEDAGLDRERPWLVIHPGASAPSRRYPGEHYAAAARRIVTDLGCQVVFTGIAAEQEIVEDIRAMMGAPSFSLVGKLNLAEFAALLAMAPLLIANNTGPVHVAAALGVQIVDLYALTNPQHSPWGVRSKVLSYDVPCKYCYKSICPEGHHSCLRLVSPVSVVRAAYELLSDVVPDLPEVVV